MRILYLDGTETLHVISIRQHEEFENSYIVTQSFGGKIRMFEVGKYSIKAITL
jgi:hypothetical protein